MHFFPGKKTKGEPFPIVIDGKFEKTLLSKEKSDQLFHEWFIDFLRRKRERIVGIRGAKNNSPEIPIEKGFGVVP
jgi:hypothetical protein